MSILQVMLIIWLGAVGAALGSFAGAQVWRLRATQLHYDKKTGEKVNKNEYSRLRPLLKQSILQDRSIDLDTGKKLPWYDMIPIFSWLALRGRSRYSKKPIGKFEFFIEVGVALFFIISYLMWPFELNTLLEAARFILWLATGVILAILFSYDYKWYLLPNNYTVALIVFGILYFVLSLAMAANKADYLLQGGLSVLILSGLYLALYLYSSGKWVGFGDVKLGLGLALFLANWQLSFLALFLANFIGVLLVLPGLIRGKIGRGSKIPFGPLLITGVVISLLFGSKIIEAYLSLML